MIHNEQKKSRGQSCGDIELTGYLPNESGPVPLVSDLHVSMTVSEVPLTLVLMETYYPNNIDRSLNEVTDDKIRKYHTDYNKNPSNTISFMPSIPSTSGRLHNEFVRLLFLQDHRETDRFFTVSGVQFVEHDRDCSTSDVRLSFNNSKAGLT